MSLDRVFAVIPTYRRPDLLRRALTSLGSQGPALCGVVVVDNGGDAATASVAAEAPVPTRLLQPGENLGTAGGIAAGFTAVFSDPTATHAWILDDDAVAAKGALDAMLSAAHRAQAAAVSAMITDHAGIVRWFPGPLPQPAWDLIRAGVTPAEFCARVGDDPLRWNWATWASLLVSRAAVAAVGLPDSAFWYQGTDIEYTLRLSARFPCVLAPAAVCPHLPPPAEPGAQRRKDVWALQNNAYISFHLPHGRRILRHLPGNHFRHWKNQGWKLVALRESLTAFWRGALLARPTGRPGLPSTRAIA